MEMRTPKLSNAVKRDDLVSYLVSKRWWLRVICDGRLQRVPRHIARQHLQLHDGLTRREADARLNQIRDSTLSQPSQRKLNWCNGYAKWVPIEETDNEN